ncbi:hypothetical protein BKA80DRAFT_42848 [Phyllosticta citrichinensis]
MARAPYWLHATMAVLSVAFFVSTLVMIATFPLPQGQISRCRMFPLLRVNPQPTNNPTSATDDNNNGITNTPAAPATPPRVRTFDIAVSGLGRTLRQLQIVFVNKNGTTTEQAAVPEQQPTHRHPNNKNNRNQQQILRPIQWLGGKRRALRLQRLREERKKKERAEAVIEEQLTGRENEANADGQTTLVQRLRAAPGRRRYRSVLRELALARKKAKKSNRKDRDGKAKTVVVGNTGLLQGLPGRPLPIWVL